MSSTIGSGSSFTMTNRFRTSLLMIGALLVLAVIAWIVSALIGNQVRRQITSTLELTRSMAQTVGISYLHRQSDKTKVVAHDPELHQAITAMLGDRTQGRALTAMLDGMSSANRFDGWALASEDGRIFASGQRSTGWPVLPPQLHARISEMLAGKVVLLPPTWVPDGEGRRAAFLTATAMRDQGRTLAILVLTMDPVGDFSGALEAARFGETGETYVCTSDGMMASRSRYLSDLKSSGLIPNEAPNAILRLSLRRPPSPVLAGSTMDGNPAEWPFCTAAAGIIAKTDGISIDDGYDYRGIPVVCAWGMLGDTGLGVITKIDRVEAFRPLVLLRWIFLSILAVLAVAVCAGIMWLGYLARLHRKLDKANEKLQKFGQYTLECKIGEGGMGAVYLARHAMMRRKTAIKLITGNITAETLMRFEREVQLCSTLSHPNTIAIYDYGRTASGTFYYAMEFLDGMDLAEMVRRFGPLPPARAIHFLAQACGSLAEAHDLHMIHRDIKPENLYITRCGGENDVLKVLDFGLVKSTGGSDFDWHRSNAISGTPLYMAPEVIGQKENIDGRSDLYSLACVGCFLLTGACPFRRQTAMDTLMAHLNDVPSLPRSINDRPIPADLVRVLLRALAKEPEQRQRTMREFREELLACNLTNPWRGGEADAWWNANGKKLVDPAHARTSVMAHRKSLVIQLDDDVT